MIYFDYYKSPIGLLKVVANSKSILQVDFERDCNEVAKPSLITDMAITQLDEYFNKKRKIFDIPLYTMGTDFQKLVWDALLKIPYGETRSYKDIAEAIKHPLAYRAVGNANNKNKIAIIIPCHRVIGANGSFVGYASGIDKKSWLLNLEKNV